MNRKYTFKDKTFVLKNVDKFTKEDNRMALEMVYRDFQAFFPDNYKSYDEYNNLIKGFWDKKNPRPEPFKSKLRKEDIKIENYE